MVGSTRAHGVEAAVHVERDDVVELLRRGLHAGLADRSRAAGDVDQDVDAAAEGLVGLLRGCVALLGVGQVAGDDDRLARRLRGPRPPPARSRPCRGRSARAGSPRRRRRWVIAAPMPLAGPVIIATRSFEHSEFHVCFIRSMCCARAGHGLAGPGRAAQNSFLGSSATGGRKARVKISSDRRRARQLVGLDQDVDRPLAARVHVDVAEPDLGDLGMVHLVLERGVEALALDRRLDQRLALGDRRHARRRGSLSAVHAAPC